LCGKGFLSPSEALYSLLGESRAHARGYSLDAPAGLTGFRGSFATETVNFAGLRSLQEESQFVDELFNEVTLFFFKFEKGYRVVLLQAVELLEFPKQT
jgi:hypothetical protein